MAGSHLANKGNRVPGMDKAEETAWFKANRNRKRKRSKVSKASRRRNRKP